MSVVLFVLTAVLLAADPPFYVRVVDEGTGRGVPLVELRTLNEVKFFTDSNGIAVIDAPELEGRRVLFHVRSHGYEFQEKVFDGPGKVTEIRAGRHEEWKIRRTNIAERLYRLTGAGIYRDSVAAGVAAPIREPLLNGMVVGQDTTIAIPYAGKLFWCWGDTFGTARANFAVSCATSELPGKGGLAPAVGVNFTYFVDPDGFSRRMLPLEGGGLVWIEGLFTVKDENGRERLVATYTWQQGLKPPDERGVAVFDDQAGQFRVLTAKLPPQRSHLSSHPRRVIEGGKAWWYLYPAQRVPDEWSAIQDASKYESFTPRELGKSELERDAAGKLVWGWKAGTDRVEARQERDMIRRGVMNANEARFRLLDAVSSQETGARPSSVAWNEYRKKWILLSEDNGGVFYSEADRSEGPWPVARKIVSHDAYNFYNVVHHPFFDEEGGRVIYFEGTYTDAFSAAKEKTPRYNYNQVMYRLRLDDAALGR